MTKAKHNVYPYPLTVAPDLVEVGGELRDGRGGVLRHPLRGRVSLVLQEVQAGAHLRVRVDLVQIVVPGVPRDHLRVRDLR